MKLIHKFFLLPALAGGLLWSCSGDSGQKYIAAKIDGSDRYSIIDTKTGEAILKDEFKGEVEVDGDLLWVANGDGIDLLDINDIKTTLAESFREAADFRESDVTVAVREGEPVCIIDRKGKEVAKLPANVTRACAFRDGLASFCVGDSVWGYMNRKGETVIKPQFTEAEDFNEGYAVVNRFSKDGCSVIDKSGKTVFAIKYGKYDGIVSAFHNGYLAAAEGNRVVLLDKNGKAAVKHSKMETPEYGLYGYAVDDGRIIYCNDNEWGLMTLDGETLIRPKYSRLDYIGDGLYAAMSDRKVKVIDANGEDVFKEEYDDIICWQGTDNILLNDNGTLILADRKGKQVGKLEFDKFSPNNITRFCVSSNYFDMDGAIAGMTAALGKDKCFGLGRISVSDAVKKGVAELEGELEKHNGRNILTGKQKLPVFGTSYVNYIFDDNIVSPIMEQVNDGWWSYEQVAGYEINKNARLLRVEFEFEFGAFNNHREKFHENLKAKLLSSGFSAAEPVQDESLDINEAFESKGCYIWITATDLYPQIHVAYQYKLPEETVAAAPNEAPPASWMELGE